MRSFAVGGVQVERSGQETHWRGIDLNHRALAIEVMLLDGANDAQSRPALIVSVLACLQVMYVAVAFADPASDYYLDPTHWKNMDWSRPESAPLWQFDGWRQIHEATNRGMALKERKIYILGEEFEALWAEQNLNGRRSLSTSFTGSKSPNRCSQIVGTLRTRLGPPIINDGTVNFSFSPDAPLHMVNINYQWDLGNTRVSASCFGVDSKNPATGAKAQNEFHWFAIYSSIADQPKLIPKFALRCSQQISTLGRKAEDIGDLVFWVDVHNKTILNGNGILLSEPKSFRADPGVIEFSINSKNLGSSPQSVGHYVLGRMNGSLEATIKQDGLPDARITGRCEKIKTIQKQF